MQIDEFLALVRNRWSVRRFKPEPVPDDYIEKILEAGRWAMSGANAQPWEFIVVRDKGIQNKIADAWLEPRREAHVIEQTRSEELIHHQLRRPPVSPGFRNAPLLIVVVGDKRTYQATIISANFIHLETDPGAIYLKNMANAQHNMHLAVAALGLGSQWVSVDSMWAQSLKTILDVPPVLDIHTIVAVGYPAYEPAPSYRRGLDEIVHYDRYDKRKYRSGEDIIQFLYHLRKRTRPAYGKENLP